MAVSFVNWRRAAAGAVALLLTIAVSACSACGNDPYSGSWTSTSTRGYVTTIQIEKGDKGWVVIGSHGDRRDAVERGGRLVVVREAEAGGVTVSYERIGDILRRRLDGSLAGDFTKQ